MDAPAPHVERHPLEALQRGDALIDHPVAARVSWRPLHPRVVVGLRLGALAEGRDGSWRSRPAFVQYLILSFFLTLTLATLLAWVVGLAEHPGGVWGMGLFAVASLVFLVPQPRWRIDPARGWLRRRWSPFSPGIELRAADVVALQILPKQGMDGTRGFELNLVLADGSRVGLMNDGALVVMRRDAIRLASVLCVQVWEAEAVRPVRLGERIIDRLNAPL